MAARKFHSVLWQELNARVGKLSLRRMELHRHLPEITTLGLHSHAFWQALLYLSGHGRQQIGSVSKPISAGSLVIIPPQVRHAFRREGRQPALCLVLSFQTSEIRPRRPIATHMSDVDLGRIRMALADISRVERSDDIPATLQRATVALQLLRLILQGSGLYENKPLAASPVLHRLEKAGASFGDTPSTLRELAAKTGFQQDYLNRRLKQETGLTLGQWHSRQLAAKARDCILRLPTIGDAGAACGFMDQNYFARWFRKQAGLTPSQWKKTHSADGQE